MDCGQHPVALTPAQKVRSMVFVSLENKVGRLLAPEGAFNILC
jgi:hypothetical protein